MLHVVHRINELKEKLETNPSKRIEKKIQKLESRYIIETPNINDVKAVYIDKKTQGKIVVCKDGTTFALDNTALFSPIYHSYAIAYGILIIMFIPLLIMTITNEEYMNLLSATSTVISLGGCILSGMGFYFCRDLIKRKKMFGVLLLLVSVLNGVNFIVDIINYMSKGYFF